MDRKKTILIAVMINAGLLVVLFIGALVSQDETVSEEIAQRNIPTPLYSEVADRTQQASPPSSPMIQIPVVAASPVQESVKPVEVTHTVEPVVVHRLPAPSVEVATPVVPPSSSAPERIASSFVEVTVKKGDSLDKIAKAHHTTAEEIIKLNQLPGSFLKIGQVLKIPDSKLATAAVKPKPSAVEKPAPVGPEYYTVKVGDNPWGIAMKHHMKVEELLKLNHLNEERARKLKPGDRLRIR